MAEKHDAPLVVDNAYGEPFPGIAESLVEPLFHPNVINCFTFSKAGLPGERIGFAVGQADAIDAMVSFLANSTLHAPQFIQSVVARALTGGDVDILSSKVIKPFYRARRQAAELLLDELLPESVAWRLHSSSGGMFCWLWIDDPWFSDLDLCGALKQRKVFVVPGRYFFTESAAHSQGAHATRCVRLSLTAEEDVIAEGIKRIADTIAELQRSASV